VGAWLLPGLAVGAWLLDGLAQVVDVLDPLPPASNAATYASSGAGSRLLTDFPSV
jgi:hypothetical protein